MNDMPDVITNCLVESYVDDTKLFISFAINDKVDAQSKIVQDLNRVAEWCCINRLLTNPQKKKVDVIWH